MADERDRMKGQNDETENDDVEAHKLKGANEEPDGGDDDVEAHKLA